MDKVYIIGSFSTAFGRRPDQSVKDLTAEAYAGVLADAGFADGDRIESAWFGNCGMWGEDQGSIRGQVCLTPQVNSGEFPDSLWKQLPANLASLYARFLWDAIAVRISRDPRFRSFQNEAPWS